MERDRSNDPYAPGKEGGEDVGLDSRTILRFGAAAMGAILIVTGLMLAVSVFGVIRDIIESPDTFVANLDAWTTSEADEAATPVTAPPAETTPTVPAQTAPESLPPADAAETTPESPPPTSETEQADPSANQNAAQIPQELRRALQSRRNQAAGTVPNRPAPQSKNAKNFFEEILDLIREGGMGRIAGAIFMLLFTALLVHIPILLIRVGVQLLTATAKIKVPAAD